MTKPEILPVDINKEMRESYLQYSMSVIVGRALPDIRDGLKPVHRRILFAMKDLGNTHDKPFKKSARVVGDVIGKYHPHGELAVYDAIVRMAQDFSMQAPLVDGQGNFGSVDGDSAAAPRYTEIRMTALAEELLQDLDKETVPFSPNYDNTLLIPDVLPARFPNLLVNGSSGIAVGMACNIPPHNLREIVKGCLLVLEKPDCSLEELMEKIPGPDFPTAGVIEGRTMIASAYKKGRGIITINSVSEVEEPEKGPAQIVITEIPYQINKARLIESMAELVKEKKIEGISDIRDESSREGLRIVVQVKKGAMPQIVLNQLQKHTQMRTSFGIIFLALDKRNQPKVFSLKEMLGLFIEHRKNVITRRVIFDLRKAQEKLHILEGLEKALSQIDEVIALIRQSQEVSQARRDLISRLKFSHRQAQAILEMRLQKLTGLEKEKIEKDRSACKVTVEEFKSILSSEERIEGILREELKEVEERYGRERRTQISNVEEEITDRDLVSDEEVVVFLTYKGLVKRIPLEEYRIQKRGGKGLKGWELRTKGDFVWKIWSVRSLDMLLVFSSLGRLHWLDVYRVPSGSRQTKARSLNNLLLLKPSEEIRAVLPLKALDQEGFIYMITKKGILKKTLLKSFSRPRAGGVTALSIDKEDVLQDVYFGKGNGHVFIFTRKGQVIRFQESDVRPTGRSSRGVRGIRLKEGDLMVAMEVGSMEERTILVVTEKGFGKRVQPDQFKVQARGGQGVLGQKITSKTGEVIYAHSVEENHQILITTNQGQSIRFSVEEVSVFGRISQGVRFINLKEGEKVTGVTLIEEEEKPSSDSHGDRNGKESSPESGNQAAKMDFFNGEGKE